MASQEGPSHELKLETTSVDAGATPSRSPSRQSVTNRRSRKNSVQVACERCRRRKIKCSGLPGPCATCASLGTVCHDPGRKRDREQSVLENRLRRLEALTLLNHPISQPEGISTRPIRSTSLSSMPVLAQPEPRYPSLQLQTRNLTSMDMDLDFGNRFASPIHFGWDNSAIPTSPACYSEIAPDAAPWSGTEQPQPGSDATTTPNPPLHKRSHTFPTNTFENFNWNERTEYPPSSAGGFSEIPSIEVTSADCSRPQSPFNPSEVSRSPRGISMPYSSPLLDAADDEFSDGFELPITPPLSALKTHGLEDQIDYYGDFLSPVDKPPSFTRRSSTASSNNDYSAEAVTPLGTRLHRSQTLPSTLGGPSLAEQDRFLTTLNSPRTRNYLQVYVHQVYMKYPIVDPTVLSARNTTNPINTYQTLLVAAIGAMVHHKSRAQSSPYLRLAMSLMQEIDFWSSISGLHCAMLLAIYCFYEETMLFQDEIEKDNSQKIHITNASHARVNLWLHNCQIASTCIDLGLNLGFLVGTDVLSLPLSQDHEFDLFLETDQERGMQAVFRSSFQVAYLLDKQISTLKQRPRAIQDNSLDPALAIEYMLNTYDLV